MGKFEKGILGGFSGKVGNVVGSRWRNVDIMRSVPRKSNRIPTELQNNQRLKFGKTTRFFAPLRYLFSKYFGQPDAMRSRVDLAISYHLKEALDGQYPNYVFNYAKIMVSKGNLLGFKNAQANRTATELKITYDNNANEGNASTDDIVVVVYYHEAEDLFFIEYNAAERGSMEVSIALPEIQAGDPLQVWAFLHNSKETSASTSNYLGEV